MREAPFTFPLSHAERASLYARLAFLGARVFQSGSDQHFSGVADERVLAIAAEESRFDYRLLYVLVEFFAFSFEKFHPYRLREESRALSTPQVWGVIGAYCSKVDRSPDRDLFFEILTSNLTRAPEQMYFNSLRRPRPQQMGEVIHRTPDEFLNWGFFSDEPPISKELKIKESGRTFSGKRREKILDRLLHERTFVGVNDYLKRLDHAITRQTAYRDLAEFPGIRLRGSRKGRRYYL